MNLTVLQIRKAFDEHRGVLFARKVEQCCGKPPLLVVQNDQVLLKRMLLSLGFSEEEIAESYDWRGELPP